MRYNQKLVNHYLSINISTNSKRIHALIKNILDFNYKPLRSNPKIKINFTLKDIGTKYKPGGISFFCSNMRQGDDIFIQAFGREIVRSEISRKKGTVKGTVAGYRDDVKEHVFYNLFMKPLQFILSYHGFFFIHSSVVSKGDNCVLITGRPNCGKSTISLVLSQYGFNLLTDDDCFVKLTEKGAQLFPFSTKIGLSNIILKKYPALGNYAKKNYSYGKKQRLSIERISKHEGAKELRCKIILFPIYSSNSRISMKEISGNKIIKRVANEFPLRHISRDYPEKEFETKFLTFYALTKKARSFELTYNDDRLDEIPALIEKIMK